MFCSHVHLQTGNKPISSSIIPGCLQNSLSFRNAPGYSLPIELEEIFTLRQTNVSVIHQLVDHEERRGVHMCSPLQTVIQPTFGGVLLRMRDSTVRARWMKSFRRDRFAIGKRISQGGRDAPIRERISLFAAKSGQLVRGRYPRIGIKKHITGQTVHA